jgi:hypothetical protein
MSVVIKVKQLQNLQENMNERDRWEQIKEQERASKLDALQNREAEINDDPMFLEKAQ